MNSARPSPGPTVPAAGTRDAASAPAGTSRARAALVAWVLVAGAAVTLALGIWHPEPDANGEFSYAVVAPIREAWWAWHLFGAVGVAAGAVAASIAVCLLVRGRGSGWADAGGALTSLGGVAFGVGIAAEGVLFAYVTDPDVLPADIGVTVMAHLADNPERFVVAIIPGFVLLTVGPGLLAVALWLARSVPRWVPVTLAVTSVAAVVSPLGAISFAVNGAFTAALAGIAWHLWRGAGRSGLGRELAEHRAVSPR